MDFKSLRQTAFLAVIAALIILSVLSAATFAWFSFSNDTNVTPISGTVSRGDGSLLISSSPNGPFDVTCELTHESTGDALAPISTADLVSFYLPQLQANGVVISYTDGTDRVNELTLHGRVYLMAEGSDCEVYFWRDSLSFGTDIQALAAMRLGLRFTTAAGTQTYIFRLDEFGATGGAEAQQTVNMLNTVVSGLETISILDGRSTAVQPIIADDPAQLTAPYTATVTDDDILAGTSPLCFLEQDEVGTVEYWLYLEGCDENCINAVQSRDVALQLGFAGA